MKTIRKITLVLIVLVLVAAMLVGISGHHQMAVATPQNGATQVAQELEIDVPEWGPILLEGDEFDVFNRVAWNS
jgi:cell division protein FtsL